MISANKIRSTFEEEPRKHPKGHSAVLIGITVTNVIAFIAVVFLNIAATFPSIGIFKKETGNISRKYPTEITPVGWTFPIAWNIIYVWQGLWLFYNLTLLFRTSKGGRLYRSPLILDAVFHLFYLSNLGFNITWLLLWDEEWLDLAFGALFCLTIALYFCVFLAHRNIYHGEAELRRNKSIDVYLMRILVNNGLAFYAAWTTIATCLNFAIAIAHKWQLLSVLNSSIIALSILSFIIFIYFALDIYFLEKFTRFTWSPYILMGIAFAGVLVGNWNLSNSTTIFALILAVIGPGLMFIIKILVTIYKSCTEK